ncbi:MAG TPA: hypothetical protein VMT77_08205 [Gemmatimonadales bacterium]|nr:hypothetical protein [Gemmatimonadales bacterium]
MSHPALGFADESFAKTLADSARGPQRDGVFALWLVVRAALAAATPAGPPARQPDRLRALAARIRSLNAPAPLRRSLAAAITDLGAPRAVAPAVVLAQLAAPAGDCLGRPAADAVQAAARAARPGARSG